MIEPMNFGIVNAKFMTFDMSLWVYSQWLDPPSISAGEIQILDAIFLLKSPICGA